MRQVISAPPHIDVSPLVQRAAAGRVVIADPSRAACESHGYQTLYEVPVPLQKRLRRELIIGHARALQAPDAFCDHSVFAWLADWMRWLWGHTPAEEWDAVLEAARPAVERSESILHVGTGALAAYDGYRWRDARNGAQVERLMRQLYRDFGVEGRVEEAGR